MLEPTRDDIETPFTDGERKRDVKLWMSMTPVGNGLNLAAHYFQTNLIWVYLFMFVIAGGWQTLAVMLFMMTDILEEVSAMAFSLMFGTIIFLVPLYLNEWRNEAVSAFRAMSQSFGQTMMRMASFAERLQLLSQTDPMVASTEKDRAKLFRYLVQLAKVTHEANYEIFIGGFDKNIFHDARIQNGIITEDEQQQMENVFRTNGAVQLVYMLAMRMSKHLFSAYNRKIISGEEFRYLLELVDHTLKQVQGMMIGGIPLKDTLLENYYQFVIGVFLLLVLPTQMYAAAGVHSVLIYAVITPLLLGGVVIPYVLGTPQQHSKRFQTDSYAKLRRTTRMIILSAELVIMGGDGGGR